jgi:sRNA-binding regulator protein Hfq
LETNKTTTYCVGNPGSGLGHAQTCSGVQQINEVQPLFDNWISNCKTEIKLKKQNKNRNKKQKIQDHTLSQKRMATLTLTIFFSPEKAICYYSLNFKLTCQILHFSDNFILLVKVITCEIAFQNKFVRSQYQNDVFKYFLFS